MIVDRRGRWYQQAAYHIAKRAGMETISSGPRITVVSRWGTWKNLRNRDLVANFWQVSRDLEGAELALKIFNSCITNS